MHLRLEHRTSPLSTLLLVTDGDGRLRALEFENLEPRMERLLREHYGTYTLRNGAAPAPLARALDAYFGGETDAIGEIPTATGGTPFQRDVWKALRAIPAGTTTSYGRLAADLGRAGSARAVGAANGANPIPIVVPCHRVIGTNGTLTGFASGLPRKRWLLDHESRFARHSLFAERPNARSAATVTVPWKNREGGDRNGVSDKVNNAAAVASVSNGVPAGGYFVTHGGFLSDWYSKSTVPAAPRRRKPPAPCRRGSTP